MYYLGFDIGGSAVKAALVKDKKILKSAVYDLPGDFDGLLNLIIKMKKELDANPRPGVIKGIGFGIAGALNKSRRIMLNSPNIEYLNNRPLKQIFKNKFPGYSIKIEHDISCFLLAEKEIGLARDLKDVFYLTLGTGIGSALMAGGRIFDGAHGAAGEAGHMVMDINKGLDLEDLAANKFLLKSMGFGSMEAGKRAKRGDVKVLAALNDLGRNLGIGLANIINVFDPEAVILGGGISSMAEFIESGIKESVEKFVISPEAKKTRILFSELGRLGGAFGAALLFE